MANPNPEAKVITGSTPPQPQPPPPPQPTNSLPEEAIVPGVKKRRNVRFAFACATLASMTSILLGYDIGVMSGAVLFIQKDLKISDTQVEVLTGILNLYSLVGSFAAGRTSDWIGRRYTIVFAAAIFFAGALLMGFAPNYALLMLGRFVAGIGVGYALMIAPVYTAEVSPASSRGFLTSFPEVFINTGILIGYISNYAFSHLPLNLGWRFMLGVGAIPSVFLAVGVLAMPESPRWLVMKGRLADAKSVLHRTSDTAEEAELRLLDIKKAAGVPAGCTDEFFEPAKRQRSGESVWKELFLRPTPPVRRILKAGITDKNKLLGTTVAVGFVKTLFILVATFLLDRVGRRPLLLSSTGGMVASLAGLGIGLTVIGHSASGTVPWAVGLSIASILAYVAFFSIGLGPITWVYTSEIFPLRLRALGCAVGVALNRCTSGVITMTFISLYKAITIGGSFFLYAGMAAAAWVFFFTYLPETRGRMLEDTGKLFGIMDTDKDVDVCDEQPPQKFVGEEKAIQLTSNNSSSNTTTETGTNGQLPKV
uniref:Major facilitator superfamily (MFS) profile domain-containing protein n=1 Tax=Ananas comosus var. bracteatus TaxID=296719 RepID=A0A6V7PNP7_ANACO|nr:unnamed protein product [Ananas comosus var. bracteatus]